MKLNKRIGLIVLPLDEHSYISNFTNCKIEHFDKLAILKNIAYTKVPYLYNHYIRENKDLELSIWDTVLNGDYIVDTENTERRYIPAVSNNKFDV